MKGKKFAVSAVAGLLLIRFVVAAAPAGQFGQGPGTQEYTGILPVGGAGLA